jgi:hypothetical protein
LGGLLAENAGWMLKYAEWNLTNISDNTVLWKTSRLWINKRNEIRRLLIISKVKYTHDENM